MQRISTRRFVYITLLSAMAMALNILESSFMPVMPMGIRVGFANIIALMTIEILGVKEMVIVNLMRVLIGNLLRGLIFSSTFWISLSGVVLSSIILVICKKLKASLLFTSILSSIAHTTGQVLFVMYLYSQVGMITILPYLLISSVGMGVLTGIVAKEAIKRIEGKIRLS